MHKVELLAPARDLEQLKIALNYGADSVYIGGEVLGMDSSDKNFSQEELIEGVKFAHERGKRVYVTVNVLPHNDDFKNLDKYLIGLEEAKVDAIIIVDPGVLAIAKKIVPNMEVHLGSQANITNYATANFWHKQGVKRVTVARELSFKEMSDLKAKVPFDMEIEAFIHGPICISYSGRRLISNYLNARNNKIDFTDYSDVLDYNLTEEKRKGEYYPVYEDKRGTFFYNSKDLCMIEFIPELIKTGLSSLKIEGRMKSSYHLASIVRAYKMAIDEFYKNPEEWKFNDSWLEEIKKGSSRDFTTGFYLDETVEYNHDDEKYSVVNLCDYIGLINNVDKDGQASIKLEDNIKVGDKIEIIAPNKKTMISKLESILNEDGESVDSAKENQSVKIKLSLDLEKDYMLRRE